MSHTRARRRAPIITLVASAALVGATLAPATAAVPASEKESSSTAGARSAGWLHREIGDVYDTFGLGVDFYLGLWRLGAYADDRDAALAAMESRTDGYTKNETSAGQTAKLTLAVLMGKKDLATYAGGALDGALEALIVPTGAEAGRAKDDAAENNTTVLGQAYAIRSLVRLKSSLLDEATAFLLKQQCSAGFFRESMDSTGSTDFTCDSGTSDESSPSIDATGHAVLALSVARAAGISGLDKPIQRAATWLAYQQQKDGSFQTFGASNTNATGLAGMALRFAGRKGRAGNAAAWVRAKQVDAAMVAKFPKLAGEKGAIAYDAMGLANAKADGITDDSRISWWFATPDAVQALPSLLPAKTVDVVAADRAARKATVKVRVKGLVAGEIWRLRQGPNQVRRGVVPSTGVVVTSVKMPNARRTVTLRAYGSRLGRTGVEKVVVR